VVHNIINWHDIEKIIKEGLYKDNMETHVHINSLLIW
jgi:hypothetical protein